MRQACFLLAASCFFLTHSIGSEPYQQSFREIGQLDIDAYYFNFPTMRKEGEWKKLVIMAETALQACTEKGLKDDELMITGQLVTFYLKLGNYEKSLEYSLRYKELCKQTQDYPNIAESYYKLSSVLRLYAASTTNNWEKMKRFEESRSYITKSFEIADQYCPNDEFLHAKIFFYAGSLEEDDLNGDCDLAIQYFEKAIPIFAKLKKEEYLQLALVKAAKTNILKNTLFENYSLEEN